MHRPDPRQAPGFGLDEAVLLIALVLLVAGLWPRIGALALTIPGAVLLWIALPPRATFVVRPETRDSARKGT
jgi:hypothetical protein